MNTSRTGGQAVDGLHKGFLFRRSPMSSSALYRFLLPRMTRRIHALRHISRQILALPEQPGFSLPGEHGLIFHQADEYVLRDPQPCRGRPGKIADTRRRPRTAGSVSTAAKYLHCRSIVPPPRINYTTHHMLQYACCLILLLLPWHAVSIGGAIRAVKRARLLKLRRMDIIIKTNDVEDDEFMSGNRQGVSIWRIAGSRFCAGGGRAADRLITPAHF